MMDSHHQPHTYYIMRTHTHTSCDWVQYCRFHCAKARVLKDTVSISVTPAATDRTAAFYTIKQEGAGHLEFITTCLSCLSSFSFLMRLTVVKMAL